MPALHTSVATAGIGKGKGQQTSGNIALDAYFDSVSSQRVSEPPSGLNDARSDSRGSKRGSDSARASQSTRGVPNLDETPAVAGQDSQKRSIRPGAAGATLKAPAAYTLDSLLAGHAPAAAGGAVEDGDGACLTARLNALLDDSAQDRAEVSTSSERAASALRDVGVVVGERGAAQHVPTSRPAPLATGATSDAPLMRRESQDNNSEDWDVVGTDDSDEQPALDGPQLSPEDAEAAKLNRVPLFANGEPQFVFGDSGGPPPQDSPLALVVGGMPPTWGPSAAAADAQSARLQARAGGAARGDVPGAVRADRIGLVHKPSGVGVPRGTVAGVRAHADGHGRSGDADLSGMRRAGAVPHGTVADITREAHGSVKEQDVRVAQRPPGGRAVTAGDMGGGVRPSGTAHGAYAAESDRALLAQYVAASPSSSRDTQPTVSSTNGGSFAFQKPSRRAAGDPKSSLLRDYGFAVAHDERPPTELMNASASLLHSSRSSANVPVAAPESPSSASKAPQRGDGEAYRLYDARRFGMADLAHPGKKVHRWQEIPGQLQAVQRQIKRELCSVGSLPGDPLGRFHFHIPLLAAVWSMVRESCVVPSRFTRGYKEVLGAAVSRGNLCRFCTYWHVNTAKEVGIDGMRMAWVKKTMAFLPTCPRRFKAIMLWLRDATHVGFFSRQIRKPFTREESAELLAVSFVNNFLNRVTVATLTHNETLPMMSVFRPIMQRFPSLHVAMYKTVMKPGSKDAAKPALSEAVRPHSDHELGPDLQWAAPLQPVAGALAHMEFVINYHLGGRHLPLDLCAAFLNWLEAHYEGIHRPPDPYGEWAFYAARAAYPTDNPRREAMRYMLFVAADPMNAPKTLQAQLKKLGWRSSQIAAMPPYASFHASRIAVSWQAAAPCCTAREAVDDSLWQISVPDEELW